MALLASMSSLSSHGKAVAGSERALRALNARAASAVAAALKAGSEVHRGSDAQELEQAIGLCNEALTWGYTSRVLHSAAEALLELGKIAHLNGKDAKALDCFEKANERLLEIEGSYEGFDKVERLQTEAQLDQANTLVRMRKLLDAGKILRELEELVPRTSQPRLRSQLDHLNGLIAAARKTNYDGPPQLASEEAAPERRKRLLKRQVARDQQLQLEEEGKRPRIATTAAASSSTADSSTADSDDVQFMGQSSRADREARVPVVDLDADGPAQGLQPQPPPQSTPHPTPPQAQAPQLPPPPPPPQHAPPIQLPLPPHQQPASASDATPAAQSRQPVIGQLVLAAAATSSPASSSALPASSFAATAAGAGAGAAAAAAAAVTTVSAEEEEEVEAAVEGAADLHPPPPPPQHSAADNIPSRLLDLERRVGVEAAPSAPLARICNLEAHLGSSTGTLEQRITALEEQAGKWSI